jgi:nitroreductase
MRIKEFIKNIPYAKALFNYFYGLVIKPLELLNLGLYTTFRTLKYSRLKGNINAWKASMRVSCHILEKGLTMPEKRLGFGQDRVLIVVNEILTKEDYKDLSEIKMAVGIIKEYDKLHKKMNYALPVNLQNLINKVGLRFPEVESLEQIRVSKDVFFSSKEDAFPVFASSRHSVRNFSGGASQKQINDSIKLALTAPSACNRQAFKCHVFNDRDTVQKVLSYQNGNRGFGHLIPQVCVLTVDLRMIGKNEQNDIYFNAGLFAMNLCYSFHYNSSATPKNDKALKKAVNIPKVESVAVIIAFGIPSEEIEIARSNKKGLEDAIILKNK